ncbi:MAG: chromosome partitioning protein ParB, partial [Gemmatimonadetes bacterium]|nr:chromosome partitioning protein ParB [Gemmatimonadota bacterium]
MPDAPKKKATRKRAKAAPEARGLTPKQAVPAEMTAALRSLADAIEADGGAVVGGYREPLGGQWQLLAALPVEKLAPTPYQRDLSDTHVARLADAMQRLGRFMDPVIAVRTPEGMYWTPNGNHR